jgi:hypothetical protein
LPSPHDPTFAHPLLDPANLRPDLAHLMAHLEAIRAEVTASPDLGTTT